VNLGRLFVAIPWALCRHLTIRLTETGRDELISPLICVEIFIEDGAGLRVFLVDKSVAVFVTPPANFDQIYGIFIDTFNVQSPICAGPCPVLAEVRVVTVTGLTNREVLVLLVIAIVVSAIAKLRRVRVGERIAVIAILPLGRRVLSPGGAEALGVPGHAELVLISVVEVVGAVQRVVLVLAGSCLTPVIGAVVPVVAVHGGASAGPKEALILCGARVSVIAGRALQCRDTTTPRRWVTDVLNARVAVIAALDRRAVLTDPGQARVSRRAEIPVLAGCTILGRHTARAGVRVANVVDARVTVVDTDHGIPIDAGPALAGLAAVARVSVSTRHSVRDQEAALTRGRIAEVIRAGILIINALHW